MSMTVKCEGPDCDRPPRNKGGKLCQAHGAQVNRGEALRPLQVRRRKGATSARDDQGRKQCGRCAQWLDVSLFSRSSSLPDGLQHACTRCQTIAPYGLTAVTYDALLAAQGGVCAACQLPPVEGQPMHVDHDHACCPGDKTSCGQCVRGILCRSCNVALGHVGDDRNKLLALVAYLDRTL